jgi:hypothetical protein
MLLSISAGLYTLYVIVGLLVGIATLIGYVKRPWTEKAKAHRKQKKVLKLFMNGDPGVEGLIKAIIPAPERVAATEELLKEHTALLKQQGDNQKAQGEVQKQQGKLLEKVASGLTNLTNIVVEFDKKMTSNGGNTNNPGDIQMRQAKRTGVWLTDEELKTLETTHD